MQDIVHGNCIFNINVLGKFLNDLFGHYPKDIIVYIIKIYLDNSFIERNFLFDITNALPPYRGTDSYVVNKSLIVIETKTLPSFIKIIKTLENGMYLININDYNNISQKIKHRAIFTYISSPYIIIPEPARLLSFRT